MHGISLRRWKAPAAAVAAAGLALTLAGCSSSGSKSGGQGSATGPVTIDYWAWTTGMEGQVAAWNKAHPDIQVKYTNVAGNLAYDKMRAAAKAGNAPCVVRMDQANTVSFASDGLLTDVTKLAAPYQAQFTDAAWSNVSPGGTTVGIPEESAPNFFAYRTDLYKQYGLTVPKTWDDLIANGKKAAAAKAGTKIWNMAGEDPSTMVGLAWDAGATWYKVDGDKWAVTFTSPESLKAADVLQQMIDDNQMSTASYADPGVWKIWDGGTTIDMATSTWQLPIYSKNFPASAGKWALAPLPQYAGATSFSTDGGFTNSVVMKGCAHPDAAVKFAAWLGTDPSALKALADPNTGAGFFPALKDVSPYLAGLAPTAMFGNVDSTAVISQAAAGVNPAWQEGPDYSAMYDKMQSLWPQVIGGKLKAADMLGQLQQFVLSDLKAKGVNAVAG